MTNNEFINKIGSMASEDMQKTKILASLTIAQAILESNWGRSSLSVEPNNNLFGIKGEYNGNYVTLPTKEYENGRWVTINAKFRKYPSWRESIRDHSDLFNRLDRYKNLRGCTDYKLACRYVREDGYATDPSYTNKLISLIETYNLNRFDTGVSSSTKPKINVYYAVQTREDGWLPEVKNLDDYAGWKDHKIVGLKMRVDEGSIEYRGTTVSGRRLGWVKGCNINDYYNGYAGNGEPLATIQAKYYTPKNIANKTGYQYLYYKVNDYPYQIDLIENKSKRLDGYAGAKGKSFTKFQAYID